MSQALLWYSLRFLDFFECLFDLFGHSYGVLQKTFFIRPTHQDNKGPILFVKDATRVARVIKACE